MNKIILLILVLAGNTVCAESFQMVRPTGNIRADQWQYAAADGYSCAQNITAMMLEDIRTGNMHDDDDFYFYLKQGRACLEGKARRSGININPSNKSENK